MSVLQNFNHEFRGETFDFYRESMICIVTIKQSSDHSRKKPLNNQQNIFTKSLVSTYRKKLILVELFY